LLLLFGAVAQRLKRSSMTLQARLAVKQGL